MDFPSGSSNASLQSLKERMRTKINGSLKAAKLNTSLAARIKTKALNNSSILKISLKHNNKALACALTVEREKSRRLESDKMFLHKEVEMLHFQNALLRQNLSLVNKLFKDIDVFMNINIPTGIELTGNMESMDLESNEQRSERLSQQSRFSYECDQGLALTGVPLRVPLNAVGERGKGNSLVLCSLGEDSANCSTVQQHLTSTVVREKSNGLGTLRSSSNTSRESITVQNKRLGDEASPRNHKLPDEASPRNHKLPDEPIASENQNLSELFGFVTRRKKFPSASRSSSRTTKSDCAIAEHRESNCSSQTEQVVTCKTPDSNFVGKSEDTEVPCDKNTEIFVSSGFSGGNKSPPGSCAGLSSTGMDCDQTRETGVVSRLETQPGRAVLPPVPKNCIVTRDNGSVTQEQTVYEAEMEMTTSDSASIVTVSSKRKAQDGKTKSGIPVKHGGTTFRKVKNSVRGKTKATANPKNDLCADNEDSGLINIAPNIEPMDDFHVQGSCCDSSTSIVQGDKMIPDSNFKADPKPQLYNRSRDRKTYILTNQEKYNVPANKGITDIDKEDVDFPAVTVPVLTPPYGTLVLPSEEKELPFKMEKSQSKGVKRKPAQTPPRKINLKGTSETVDDVRYSKKFKSKTSKRKTNQENKYAEDDQMSLHQAEDLSDISDNFESRRVVPSRRETYVVIPTQSSFSSEVPSVDRRNKGSVRRETYVINEPVPQTFGNNHSTPDKATDKEPIGLFPPSANLLEPVSEMLLDKKSVKENTEMPRTFTEFTTHSCDMEKLITGAKQNVIKKSFNSAFTFPEDRRKTVTLPDARRNEKVTLARESLVSVAINKPKKSKAFAVDYLTNDQDSFMLDMVSDSVLDTMIETPSFLCPSSVSKRESSFLFITEKSSNYTALVELPGIDKLNHRQSGFSTLDETNCNRTHLCDTNNLHCEDLNETLGSHGTASNPFKDLTNTKLSSIKQSPKSCCEEEDQSDRLMRRRRNLVNYKEPSLNKKLRDNGNHSIKGKRKKSMKKKNISDQ